MKKMEYTPYRTVDILHEGTYKHYTFLIVSYGTHPCAYVLIPFNHPLYNEYPVNHPLGKHNISEIKCHGGVSYSNKNGIFFNTALYRSGYWIGWDYNHCGVDFNASPYVSSDLGKHWTTEEIYEEVKSVVDQLIELDKNW